MKSISKSLKVLISVTFFVLISVLNVSAQVFFPGPTVELPSGSGPYQVITADFNGDNNADIAVTNYLANKVSIWLGYGDGSLLDRIDYTTGTNPISLAAGDFNGDNKLDCAVANFLSHTVSIFIGNGDGTLLTKVDYATGQRPYYVITRDFNGDNILDLAAANYLGNTVSVLIGNGDGTFMSKIDYATGALPVSITQGDFNGDNQLDLAVANYNSASVSVFLGNGDGTFASKLDFGTGLWPFSVTSGDFNGDNIVDLATINYGTNTASILIGNGNGTFLSKVDFGVGVNPRSITAADFNGDNKMDIAVANYNGASVSILAGNGDGTFSSKVDYNAGLAPYSVATGDFNGDSNLDISVTNYNSSTVSILIGNGDCSFLSRVDYAIEVGSIFAATGDFNEDNNIDLVIVNTGNKVGILLGNGNGTFLSKVDYLTGAYPDAVTTGDFNRDNNEDLAVANYNGGTISILLGNGDGTFLDKVDYTAGAAATSIAEGDFNGDNITDLVVTGAYYVYILLGNGDGTFMDKVDYAGAGGRSVITRDFNGDSILDLAVSLYNNSKVGVYLGNGDGTFMNKVDYTTGGGPYSLVAADFNGDNKYDLATANYIGHTISILLGNGNGTFISKVDYSAGQSPQQLITADFNGDSKSDIATANYIGNTTSLLIGNGDGTFARKINYGVGERPKSLTTGDFNSDNKLDLAVANAGNSNHGISILLNQAPSSHPPTDIALSNSNVNENSPLSTLVGILSATGSNPGQTFTFSELEDPDNKFSVVANEIRVDGELDFENAVTHSITIRVTDDNNLIYDEQFIIIINNLNEAPADIMLSNSTVNENASIGTVIGTLTAIDPDAGATLTFSELNDPDNKFAVEGNELLVDGILDFETAPGHTVTIRVTDNGGLTYDKLFNITVIDFNEGSVVVNLFDSQNIGLTGGEVQFYDGGWKDAGVTINGILLINYEGNEDKLSIKMKWKGYTQQLLNQNISSPIVFQTLNSKLKLIDSEGNGITSGEAEYYASGWKTFGITDNNGNTPGVELLPGTYSFKMKHAGYTQQKSNINIVTTNPLIYQTVKMFVTLIDSDENGVAGGEVSYYASGWRDFGVTDENGNTTGVELLPGTYSFKMKYAGYTQQKSNVDIITTNPLIFRTGVPPTDPQPVVVRLIDSDGNGIPNGVVTYYASGWKHFGVTDNNGNTLGVELLPGTYSFKMQYAGYTKQISNVDISLNNPLTFSTQKMIVNLNNSSGIGIPNGAVTYYASGWKDFGVTDNDGYTPGVELLPGTYSFKMNYAGYIQQISNIDISLNNPLTFSTQRMIVKINNSSGNGIANGVVTYYASGWKDFGVTDNDGNTLGVELLPGTYSFKMQYAGYTQQKTSVDITNENPLIFSTLSMVVKLIDSQGEGLSGGEVKYYASGWNEFGLTDEEGNTEVVELLPGTYSFKVNYSGMTTQKSNIDISLENPLVFQYAGGGLVKNNNYENVWEALEVPTEYALKNNYPNPFNPSTTIEFSLPEDVSKVTLSIYNVAGEELLKLLNVAKSAGFYKVTFDGSDLPSGIYFYQLKAGNYTATKKLLLLK